MKLLAKCICLTLSFFLADQRELKIKISIMAPNPLLTIDDVIEARKARSDVTESRSMSESPSLSSSKSSNLGCETSKRGKFSMIFFFFLIYNWRITCEWYITGSR